MTSKSAALATAKAAAAKAAASAKIATPAAALGAATADTQPAPALQQVITGKTDRVSSPEFGQRRQSESRAVDWRTTVIANQQFEGLPGPKCVHLFRASHVDEDGLTCEARAVVRYTCGASSGEIVCDWRGQFSLVCTAIQIDLLNYPPVSLEAEGAAVSKISFGAHVGIGAVAGKPTLTGLPTSMGSGSYSAMEVPPLASRWFPLVGRAPADLRPILESDLSAFAVQFKASTAGASAAYALHRLTPRVLREGLYIPDHVRLIWVIGGLSMGTYTLRHRFELAL